MDTDYWELTHSDLVVLFVVGDEQLIRTHIHRTALIFEGTYSPEDRKDGLGGRFRGRFSDDIDESVTKLSSTGVIGLTPRGYTITDYGRRLREHARAEIGKAGGEVDRTIAEGAPFVARALSEVPDGSVVGISSFYYRKATEKPTIKKSADRMNDSRSYDGRRLADIPREEFENGLRRGRVIHLDEC